MTTKNRVTIYTTVHWSVFGIQEIEAEIDENGYAVAVGEARVFGGYYKSQYCLTKEKAVQKVSRAIARAIKTTEEKLEESKNRLVMLNRRKAEIEAYGGE